MLHPADVHELSKGVMSGSAQADGRQLPQHVHESLLRSSLPLSALKLTQSNRKH